jgi:hypothetical protein
MHDEQVADNGEGQIAVEEPKSVDQLGKSIAKFSSRHSYARSTLRKRIWFDWLVQVGTRALRAAQELSRSCAEAFEVIRVDTRVLVRSRFTC